MNQGNRLSTFIERLGPPAYRWSIILITSLTGSYCLWLTGRQSPRLWSGAREIQQTLEEYAADNGRYPSFLEFSTKSELQYRRAPINPFTERRMFVHRCDREGHLLYGRAGMAGNLGYWVSSEGRQYCLFLFGRGDRIVGTLRHARRLGASDRPASD